MTLVGNVVLTKCGDVITGERLWINMDTGVSRVESTNTGRGICAQFNPSPGCAAADKPDHDMAPDSAKPPSGRPPRPK